MFFDLAKVNGGMSIHLPGGPEQWGPSADAKLCAISLMESLCAVGMLYTGCLCILGMEGQLFD
jgi:hypothetical protein